MLGSPLGSTQVMSRFLVLGICTFLAACGGTDGGTTPQQIPTSVRVTPSDGTITAIGGTLQLGGQVLDAEGKAIGSSTLQWSSSAVGVATVNGSGLVTGITNGTASITATASGLTASALVTVQQEATVLTVTPGDETVFVEATAQFGAVAADANGNEMPEAPVVWTSGDTGIATVDETGLATGVAAGVVTLTATSGAASGTATLTVLVPPDPLEPGADTNLQGEVAASTVVVPAGVTVTATSALTITATEAISIAGTIVGDCVAITLDGSASVTITGTVVNSCSGAVGEVPPGITLLGDGALTLTGATVTSFGAIIVGNDREAAGAGASSSSTRAPDRGTSRVTPSLTSQESDACSFVATTIESRTSSELDGASGVATGGDGRDGRNVLLTCRGDITFDDAALVGGDGGAGGAATNPAGDAVGGKGGSGGDVSVRTGSTIIVVNGVSVRTGSGGPGGRATASGIEPTATGGRGGEAGQPFLVAMETRSSPATSPLRFQFGNGGSGGNATATALDGNAATSSATAEEGGSATATGGRGGDTGSNQAFTPAHLSGIITNAFVQASPDPEAGKGGNAIVTAGNGGAGNAAFPGGGRGGAMGAIGGDGGNTAWVNGTGVRLAGRAGAGGDIRFQGGGGGSGFDGCSVDPTVAGGIGGAGGIASGRVGVFGLGSAEFAIASGATVFQSAGNGGAGGNGAEGGAGGGAGTDGVTVSTKVTRTGTNFAAGASGGECSAAPTNTALVVTDGGELFVIDLATMSIAQQVTITDPNDLHRGIARSMDGLTVWVVTEGGVVKALDAATREELVSVTRPAGLKAVAVHPTTGKVYIANSTTELVTPLNPQTGMQDGTAIPTMSGQQILFTPDGSMGFLRTSTGVTAFDPAAGSVVGSEISLINPSHMAMTPDGSKVYVLYGSGTGSVSVIDVATRMVTKTIAIGGTNPSGELAVSPDGATVWVNPGLFTAISVIDTATDVKTGEVPAAGLTDRVAFSVNGLIAYMWGITTLHALDLLGNPVAAALDLGYVLLALLLY
jgi:YVTN family beta-propeller protein